MSAMEEGTYDTEYLLSLARQKSAESRAKLSHIIIDLFDNKSDVLSDRQRTLMFGILQSVVDSIEESVREAVADRLSMMDDVPREIVNRLANDTIKVAFPILSKSGMLRDNDLIEIIKLRSEEHMLAITLRNSISVPVSGALVESGHEKVIVSLLQNPNARISASAMAYLVEESQRVDSFREPIIHRAELSPDLAKRMFLWVSAALREHIVKQFSLDKSTVDELLERVAAEKFEDIRSDQQRKSAALASTLDQEGMVGIDMLLAALRDSEVSLFVALFARISKLREFLVQRLVFEPGGEGLAIACRAIGISEEEFLLLFEYCHLAKAGVQSEVERKRPALRAFYAKTPRKAAVDVLKMWHRGSDYLSALRELEIRLKDYDAA